MTQLIDVYMRYLVGEMSYVASIEWYVLLSVMQVAFETFGGGSVNHDILIFYKIILCFIVSKALDKKNTPLSGKYCC